MSDKGIEQGISDTVIDKMEVEEREAKEKEGNM